MTKNITVERMTKTSAMFPPSNVKKFHGLKTRNPGNANIIHKDHAMEAHHALKLKTTLRPSFQCRHEVGRTQRRLMYRKLYWIHTVGPPRHLYEYM